MNFLSISSTKFSSGRFDKLDSARRRRRRNLSVQVWLQIVCIGKGEKTGGEKKIPKKKDNQNHVMTEYYGHVIGSFRNPAVSAQEIKRLHVPEKFAMTPY